MSTSKYEKLEIWRCEMDRKTFYASGGESGWSFTQQVRGGRYPIFIELVPCDGGYWFEAWDVIDAMEIDLAKVKRWLERHGLPDGSKCKIMEKDN